MGCDIHAFVELWDGQRWRWANGDLFPKSESFHEGIDETWDPFPGRWYHLFAMLAGVRQPSPPIPVIHEPRGLPDDVSDEVREKMGTMPCDRQNWEHRHIPQCCESDWHSHSWATGAELLAYDLSRPYEHERWGPTLAEAISWGDRFKEIAALADDPEHVRVVYAFDS